jgi:phosphoribosylanthranilate isomerase
MSNRPLLKVCGVTRDEDAELLMELGVDMIGFIFHPKSPRFICAGACSGMETGNMKRVGVIVDGTVETMAKLMNFAKLDYMQLAGDQDPEFCKALGPERVIKVVWPERYETREELEAHMATYAGAAAMLLLDAGKSGGGHGRSLSFENLKGLKSPLPWLLAGGLGPHNVSDALAAGPVGLDVNSGVELEPGIKDHEKVRQVAEIVFKEKA